MATTKTRSSRSRTSSQRSTSGNSNSTSSRRRSLAGRTGKAISDRPVASAAIGTGLIAGIAAGVAGFLAFKRSGKSFSEFSGDMTTRVKDGLSEAGSKAWDMTGRRKDGLDEDRSQEQIAEEAMTLKQTGKKSKGPRGPLPQQEIKAGIAASNQEAKAGAQVL